MYFLHLDLCIFVMYLFQLWQPFIPGFNMYTLELDFQIIKPTSSKLIKPFFITLFIFMRKIGFYTVNKLKYFANFIFIFLVFYLWYVFYNIQQYMCIVSK